MEAADVAEHVLRDDPELQAIAQDLRAIGERFAAMKLASITRGDATFRGLSWRCRAIANANLLRGEELYRFAILAINEGAIVVAHVLVRALDETLSAVVFARRKLERGVEARDPLKLHEWSDRITVGSRYMNERNAEHPRSFNVMDMVDETGKFLAELVPEAGAKFSAFRENYDFVSEFVHPSMGSFAAYQKTVGQTTTFERAFVGEQTMIASLLANLQMAGHFLIAEAEALAGTKDLPADWPGPATEGSPAGS